MFNEGIQLRRLFDCNCYVDKYLCRRLYIDGYGRNYITDEINLRSATYLYGKVSYFINLILLMFFIL